MKGCKLELMAVCCGVACFFISCDNGDTELYRAKAAGLQSRVDSMAIVNELLADRIVELQDSLSLLKYPPRDRFATAERLFNEGNLDESEVEISQLLQIFPKSGEAQEALALKERIVFKRKAIKEEQDRLEALGFKALKQSTSFQVGYNRITLTNIITNRRFTFDSYDDSYHYTEADRGSKYVSMMMTVTSTEHDPKLPQFAIYKIDGSRMSFVASFETRYNRWRDYGAYLGNYTDYSNDFSKVGTIRFKLGAEVPDDVLNGSYSIVMYNGNVLEETYNRWNNPPQSWYGGITFPQYLSIDNFTDKFRLVKIYNLK